MCPAPFDSHWRLRPLILLNLFSLLLLTSWVWPVTHALWASFDDELFILLNGSLENSRSWAMLWAIASIRPMDIVMGLIMLWVMTRNNWAFSSQQIGRGVLSFLILLLLMLSVRPGFTDLSDHLGWQHASPSLLEGYAVRLTELFPDWHHFTPKDAAGHSFPGDHASILLLWALFLSFFARGWKLAFIWGLTLLFMLPRLIAGAHWGSDDFVGGLFLSLMAIAWGCYTPLLAYCEQALIRTFHRLWHSIRIHYVRLSSRS